MAYRSIYCLTHRCFGKFVSLKINYLNYFRKIYWSCYRIFFGKYFESVYRIFYSKMFYTMAATSNNFQDFWYTCLNSPRRDVMFNLYNQFLFIMVTANLKLHTLLLWKLGFWDIALKVSVNFSVNLILSQAATLYRLRASWKTLCSDGGHTNVSQTFLVAVPSTIKFLDELRGGAVVVSAVVLKMNIRERSGTRYSKRFFSS